MTKTKKQIADEAKQLADALNGHRPLEGLLRLLALLIHDLAAVAEIEGANTKPLRRKK